MFSDRKMGPTFVPSDMSEINTEGNSLIRDIIVAKLAQWSLGRLKCN